LLPAALILLFGYVSFDVRDAPVAVVLEDRSETARDAVAVLSGSPYLAPVAGLDVGRAVALLRAHTPSCHRSVAVDFRAQPCEADTGRCSTAMSATTAMTIGTYIDGAIQTFGATIGDRKAGRRQRRLARPCPAGLVQCRQHQHLVSGARPAGIVITLIGRS
jgi:ABC-2 type transport system permease protein